jgi:hypothetical protein
MTHNLNSPAVIRAAAAVRSLARDIDRVTLERNNIDAQAHLVARDRQRASGTWCWADLTAWRMCERIASGEYRGDPVGAYLALNLRAELDAELAASQRRLDAAEAQLVELVGPVVRYGGLQIELTRADSAEFRWWVTAVRVHVDGERRRVAQRMACHSAEAVEMVRCLISRVA